jgi:hypothetical protein
MLTCPVHLPTTPGADSPVLPAGLAGYFRSAAPGLSALASTFLLTDALGSPKTAPPAAQGEYHLFHPTPREFLRELESDRPDQTESPITVDAGHFQVEVDLFAYATTTRDGIRESEVRTPVLNLKVGLLNQADLQVVLSPYGRVRVEDETGTSTQVVTRSGFGDLEVRTKVNLWGNDAGPTALAAMPFIHVPTGDRGFTTGAVEGGVIFPFGSELPAGFGLGMMWEVDGVRDADAGGYHAEFVQTLTVNRDLTKRVSAYVEFFTVVSTEPGSTWIGMFDFGLNYRVTPNLKFDAGLNLGVTDSAPDWVPFAGVTWRY